MKPKVYDLVRLLVERQDLGVPVGAVGTVVLIHGDGEAFEVEFPGPDVFTADVVTLGAGEVELVRMQRTARDSP